MMNDKAIIKLFLRFLKKENIYAKVKHYNHIYGFTNSNIILDKLDEHMHCDEFWLCLLFHWRKTKEGGEYWTNYAIKWSKIVNDIKTLKTR